MKDLLFEPYKLKGLELKNRLVFAAADGGCSADLNGLLHDREIERYSVVTDNEVGLIETGCFGVHPYGFSSSSNAHLLNDNIIPSLKKLTDKIHQTSTKIAAQVYHNGIWAAGRLKEQGIKALAASDIQHAYPYQKQGFINNYRVASDDDLIGVIHAFGEAARRVKKAGFDAIVVHGAHDTLLSQFLSPITNRRKDQWGGSIENRSRIHIEILKAIRKQVGDEYCVMIKLGVIEPYSEGLSFPDGKKTAKILYQAGYNMIEISQGQNGLNWEETCVRQKINKPRLEGYFRQYCKEIHAEGIPTVLTGGLRSYSVIDDILKNHETDLVGLCRPLIKDPTIISDWRKGNYRKSDCTSCNKCLMAIRKNLPLACYLNMNID